MTISFTVDRPLSVNRMYGRGKGRRLFLTSEGKDFKARLRVGALIAATKQGWPKDLWTVRRVEVAYTLEGYRGDTDGPRKPVRDALEGILYVNDRVVQDGPVPLPAGKPPSKIHITVTLLETCSAAEAKKLREAHTKAQGARARANARKVSAA